MCGSSLRLDYLFLTHHMPSMRHRFHYRQGDVSSVMEFCKRFYPGMSLPTVKQETTHCAMHDVEASLNLMRWFRQYCFLFPPSSMPSSISKTYYWGFDAIGGPPVPSSLDHLEVPKREWSSRSHLHSKYDSKDDSKRIRELEAEVALLKQKLKKNKKGFK